MYVWWFFFEFFLVPHLSLTWCVCVLVCTFWKHMPTQDARATSCKFGRKLWPYQKCTSTIYEHWKIVNFCPHKQRSVALQHLTFRLAPLKKAMKAAETSVAHCNKCSSYASKIDQCNVSQCEASVWNNHQLWECVCFQGVFVCVFDHETVTEILIQNKEIT